MERTIVVLDDCWRYCLVAGKKALEDAKLGQEVLDTVSISNYDKTMISFELIQYYKFTIGNGRVFLLFSVCCCRWTRRE